MGLELVRSLSACVVGASASTAAWPRPASFWPVAQNTFAGINRGERDDSTREG